MTELVLYDGAGTPSPRRVKLCLFEKGLPFKIKWLNLGLMDQKNPGYLAISPTGLVPALVHDGKAIYESNVINEYLDATFPDPPLVPKDPWGQAQMRMWFAFENDLAKPFRDAVYETFAKDRVKSTGLTPEKLREEISRRTSNRSYADTAVQLLTTPRNEELIKDRQLLLLEKMEQMERRLSDGRPWLTGEAFTLADIALGPRVDMFPAVGIADLYARFPRIGAFMARMKARPSWEKSAVRPEPGETERVITAEAA
jgi:glutathione S-transferase